jgi:hypothetical protein
VAARRGLTLHVAQAAFGDCLLLECTTTAGTERLLIDGGPQGNYARHLAPLLDEKVPRDEGLDIVLLSHVDLDHVSGLIEMMSASLTTPDAASVRRVRSVWHNAFSATIGRPVATSLRSAAAAVDSPGARDGTDTPPGAARTLRAVLNGVAEGDRLRALAERLGIAVNDGFRDQLIVADARTVPLGDADVTVVGPTPENLAKLRKQWLSWLRRQRGAPRAVPVGAVAWDRSVPNMSSISLLVERKGRRLLLTGDARSDHLLDGLERAGSIPADGGLHVDVLKLPHHGSARNVDPTFLARVTADTYVISADGRYGNPDLACLIWIVEAARRDRRRIELVATNSTAATDRLVDLYPPRDYGYTLKVLRPDRHAVSIRI